MATGLSNRRGRLSAISLPALLLALSTVLVPHAAAKGAKVPEVRLELVQDKPEWQRAHTHEAMHLMYNTSLYPDLEPYRARVRLASALGIANQLKRYHGNNTRVRKGTAVLVVRKGKVSALTYDDFHDGYRVRIDAVVAELQRHQDAGHIKLQDTILVMNLRDMPQCSVAGLLQTWGYCLVPVFSFVKEVRNGNSYNDDILVPMMAHVHEHLVYADPNLKVPKAAMVMYKDEKGGSERGGCRFFVHRFGEEPERGGTDVIALADETAVAAATNAARGGDGGSGAPWVPSGQMSGLGPVPPPVDAMAAFRVLINCDCQTVHFGFSHLMHLNSMVVKGRSNWMEFFHRALEDGVHYRMYDSGFIVEIAREEVRPKHVAMHPPMIEAAQKFAYTYLSKRSRALFYERAIEEYNKLFGPGYMQATIDELPAGRPLTMDDILALRMYPRSWRQGLARTRTRE